VKYAVEMGSGVIMYIPGFRKFASGIQKLMAGGYKKSRQHGDLISQILFFKIRKVD
jgi:hypothetical protein